MLDATNMSIVNNTSAYARIQTNNTPTMFINITSKSQLLYIAILIAIPAYFTITWLYSQVLGPNSPNVKADFRIPASVPRSGLVLLQLFLRPMSVLQSSKHFDCPSPIRFNLFVKDIYFNQGAANITALFSNKSLSAFFLHGSILYNCFRLSKSCRHAYLSDNSGPNATPLQGSNVQPNNRVEHLTLKWHHRFLAGAGLSPLCKGFDQSFAKRVTAFENHVRELDMQGDDLLFVLRETLMGPSIIDAILGPALLERQPEFLTSFWVIHENFWALASGLPQWIVPKAHAAVKKCLTVIKKWHAWAKVQSEPHSDPTAGDNSDAFWGSKFIRERQMYPGIIEGFTQDDVASHDLGLVWAATHNTVTSLFWLLFDVYNNSDILARVREESEACLLKGSGRGPPVFDLPLLVRRPYLQAVYAETLRLRTHGIIVRHPRQPVQVNGWAMSRNSFIATSSTTAHLNPEVWSCGHRGSRPVWEYAPERFLSLDGDKTNQIFSMSGLEGHWIPFGGGVWACPGRHFAKQITLSTLATFVTLFDIDILEGEYGIQMKDTRFGFGVLEPTTKVPFQAKSRV